MYAFLDRMDADAFEAIAAQAYVEMLKAGYTAVAEFHYVHHDPRACPIPIRRSSRAGSSLPPRDTGIGLTLLPVFYAMQDSAERRPPRGSGASCTRSTRTRA